MLKITWWMEVESEIEGPCVWPQSLFPLHGSTWPSSRLYLISFPRMPLLSISWGRRDNSTWPSAATLLPCQPDSLLSLLSPHCQGDHSSVLPTPSFHPSWIFLVLPLILSIQYFIFVYHSHLPFLKRVLPLNTFFQKVQGIMFLAFIVKFVKVIIICGFNPYPNIAFRSLSLKAIEELEVFGAWAGHSSCFMPCNKHCTFFHHNLVSVDWLCCTVGKWIQVKSENNNGWVCGIPCGFLPKVSLKCPNTW